MSPGAMFLLGARCFPGALVARSQAEPWERGGKHRNRTTQEKPGGTQKWYTVCLITIYITMRIILYGINAPTGTELWGCRDGIKGETCARAMPCGKKKLVR